MSRSRRGLGVTLTIAGTALVGFGALALGVWLLMLLDHVAGSSEENLRFWPLCVALGSLALSFTVRLLYRRWFGVAADAEGWLRQVDEPPPRGG